MIPSSITKSCILKAIQHISRDGVPQRRKSRDYCLAKDGDHFPPKYTIALANKIATGQFLGSDEFEGGSESNRFLESLGFDIIECTCGGQNKGKLLVSPSNPVIKTKSTSKPKRHSERCPECKIRVHEILEHIYGKCIRNHRFPWSTRLSSYTGTPVFPILKKVASTLERYRGFKLEDFVKTENLAPCDFWVPDPGFIVEFDESQHFTKPRKLSLSRYPDCQSLGFSRSRWTALCKRHDAKDNDPPYRDEQRAWYDTLRDIVPSLEESLPTLRLYAQDFAWCSLDSNSNADRQRFLNVAFQDSTPYGQSMEGTDAQFTQENSTLRIALVFPKTNAKTSNGVPPNEAEFQKPDVPSLVSFVGETVDFVLFPESYISSSDDARIDLLSKLASDLDAPLLVGASDKYPNSKGKTVNWQILLRIDPDGSHHRIYTKHSTAEAIAFEKADWEPNTMLPTFEIGKIKVGATICHDQYLSLLPRFLASRGARVWVNPSFDNVVDIKWSSVLRLRAVENRFFALCTLHDNKTKNRTHPFAFSPDGRELMGRKAGSEVTRPLSQCKESDAIYIVDLDMTTVGKPINWSQIPCPVKPQKNRSGKPKRPVRVKLINKQPAVLGRSDWQILKEHGCYVQTNQGLVYIGLIPKERILDPTECFRILDEAKHQKCHPIIWNTWDELPTDSARLATLMMGRAIECCAPILISDRTKIHELVELSNRIKIPARRTVEESGEAIVDIGYAWGLDNAFNMVTSKLPRGTRQRGLDRYRKLA